MFNTSTDSLSNEIRGDYIREPNADVYTITKAEVLPSKQQDSKSVTVVLHLLHKDGAVGKVRIVTHDKKGDPSFGHAFIAKIAYCMGAKENCDLQTVSLDGVLRIKSLEGKEVGLFLNTKDELSQDMSKVYLNLVLLEVFDAKTKQLSSEKREGKQAELYEKFLEKLTHIPLKTNSEAPKNKVSEINPPSTAFDDNDIPFN